MLPLLRGDCSQEGLETLFVPPPFHPVRPHESNQLPEEQRGLRFVSEELPVFFVVLRGRSLIRLVRLAVVLRVVLRRVAGRNALVPWRP